MIIIPIRINHVTKPINWVENLEARCQELIYSKRESWFESKLEKLFRERTYKLRSDLGQKRKGPRPKLTRNKINKAIEELQELASNVLAKGLAREEFNENAEVFVR